MIVRFFILYLVGCILFVILFYVLVKLRDIFYFILGFSVIKCDVWLIKYKVVVMVVYV